MTQDAESTITAYYDALEAGEPLSSFFLESVSTIKVSLSETFVSYPDVANELSEQTATTDDWQVDSHELTVEERDEFAWFYDEVTLAWTDIQLDAEYEFETRWTGTLEPSGESWQFVSLHVSTPTEDLQTDDALFEWDD